MKKILILLLLLIFFTSCSEKPPVVDVNNPAGEKPLNTEQIEAEVINSNPQNFILPEEAYSVLYGFCHNGKWGIINGGGEIVVEPKYAFSTVLDNGMYLLSEDYENINTGKLYNSDGELVFPEYDKITVFGGGPDCNSAYVEMQAFLYEENGLKGLISEDGTIITEALYEDVRGDYTHNYFPTYRDGKYGVATFNGEVTSPIYDFYPSVLGVAENLETYAYTSGLIDEKLVYYKMNEPVSVPEGYYLEQLQNCFILYSSDSLMTLDEDMNILHKFSSGVEYSLIGSRGAYSYHGILEIYDGEEFQNVDKYGNYIYIQIGESVINDLTDMTDYIDTLGGSEKSIIVDFYNLDGRFLYTEEILLDIDETRKYVEYKNPTETLFTLRIGPYWIDGNTYFGWVTDGSHPDDLSSRVYELMSSSIGEYE